MRFVVHESEGFLRETGKLPGITVAVLDTWCLWRVVGLFRSEDELGFRVTRTQARAKARLQGLRLAALLNGEA